MAWTQPDDSQERGISESIAALISESGSPVDAVLKIAYASLSKSGEETLRTQSKLALVNLRQALANAGTTPANILAVGHSLVEGQGATALGNRWINQFLMRLRVKYQPVGVTGGVGYIPCTWIQTSFKDPGYAVSGSPAVWTTQGLGGRFLAFTGTQSRSFTVSGTSVDLVYIKNTTVTTLGYSVDGGAVVSVSQNAASLSEWNTTRVTFGSRGSHTITVSAVAGTAALSGIIVYDQDETAGVRLYDAAHFGWSTQDYALNLGAITTRANPLRSQCAALQPQGVILQLLGNDYLHNVPSATTRASLAAILAEIRTGCTKPPSIILVADYPLTYSTYNGAASSLEPWANYLQVGYDLAVTDPAVSLVDLGLRVPAQTVDVLGGYADVVHVNDKYHALIGSDVAALF